MREPGAPIRVVTVNTWKGDGPYRERLRALCEQLQALDPDVIALQEVLIPADGSPSTPECLARVLGMNVLTFANRRKQRIVEARDVDSWSGLALLSRWPVAESMAYQLPEAPEDGDRAVLFGAYQTPIGAIRVGCTHLTHLHSCNGLRREQLRAILASPFLRRPAAARLLAGDMNATPGTPEMGWLLGDTHEWHVLDAYDAAAGPEMRATMSGRNPFTHEGVGERVIDYVFSLADSPEHHPALTDARVVCDRPSGGGVYPSDHFGVAVDIGGTR